MAKKGVVGIFFSWALFFSASGFTNSGERRCFYKLSHSAKNVYCILKVAFLLLHAICFCGSKQIPSPRTGKVRLVFPCWQDAIKIHGLDSQQHPRKKHVLHAAADKFFFILQLILGKSFEEHLGNSVVLSHPIFFPRSMPLGKLAVPGASAGR